MANRWNIPASLEMKVRVRDRRCVFCGIEFRSNPRDRATFEHLDNDAQNIPESNIALCCASCNSSKGARSMKTWLESAYCQRKRITRETVAQVVRDFIRG
jgi:hypothetical protein